MGNDALYIEIIESAKKLTKILWPFVILIFINIHNFRQIIFFCIVAACHFILIPTIIGCLRFYKTRVRVDEQKIFLRKNIINKEDIIIPINNVYALRTKQSPAYRLFDMVKVTIDTIASKEQELSLIMTMEDLSDFVAAINEYSTKKIEVSESEISAGHSEYPGHPFHDGDTQYGKASSHSGNAINEENGNEKTIHYTIGQLITGASTQNHLKGAGTIFIIIYTFYNKFDNFINKYLNFIEEKAGNIYDQATILDMIITIGALYLLFLILWNIKVILRNYGRYVQFRKSSIETEGGFLTRKSTIIQKDKIIAITTKTNPLEKIFNIETVKIELASFASGEEKNDRNIFYAWREKKFLKEWWIGTDSIDNEYKALSGKGLFWYNFFTRWLFASIIVGIVSGLIFKGYYWIPVVTVTILMGAVFSYFKMKRSSISISQKMILICSGSIADVKTYLPFEKVETVAIKQSIFQKKSRRAGIQIGTKKEIYIIRSLSFEEAENIRNYLLFKMETL